VGNKYTVNVLSELDSAAMMQEATAALYAERQTTHWKDDPTSWCLPFGVVRQEAFEFRIVQLPDLIVQASSQPVREIFLDGRQHPSDPNPTWLGYSIGHWDGNVLVVETIGFNGKAWLDRSGHPMTERARVTERFSRSDYGHLEIQVTIDDPAAYRRPWTITKPFQLTPDTPLLESVCVEGNASLGKHVEPPR
jgi:hypothetical protein